MGATIQMVDLKSQYNRLKGPIDEAIQSTIDNTRFIKGPNFTKFQEELSAYLNNAYVIACANGTDALQIAFMALNLEKGDEVIVPAFTYAATAEVIGLLGLTPVMVDVDPQTFNLTVENIRPALTSKTKAIVPVHLFGQCAEMEGILKFAKEHNLYVIEDTAQAIGSTYTFSDGTKEFAGCMGDIGTTSFFPSKNLGCFGDGGAIFTRNTELAERLRMIANHGQAKQYFHEIIGVNSRLDELQAAILRVKLPELDDFNERRRNVADFYDQRLSKIPEISTPFRNPKSSHVFHQYTILVKSERVISDRVEIGGRRDELKNYLATKGIPSMIYYPMPLDEQKAFSSIGRVVGNLEKSKQLCKEVLSLPIHTEMDEEQLTYITEQIIEFFKQQ
ncbi:DegT/DnrJ/EryC1/StrS family aminotransferase [Sandaracinomonas limnophila]|nr:DegT/DnrJ/EryC1/StrS family aminotransferase [Sandaracinomonas limnophila]